MEIVYHYSWYNRLFYGICLLINGCFIYSLFVHYVRTRQKFIYKVILFLTLSFSSGMVIWLGDNNLILTFPVFIVLAFLCTEGNRVGRLSVIFTIFCMEMSVCAFIDTYIKDARYYNLLGFTIYPSAGRSITYTAVYLFFKRKLPEKTVSLPIRLWKIIFGLSLLPLCTLIAMVSLTYGKYYSSVAEIQAMYLGLVILPFIFLTSFAILTAISALADHEQLEQAHQLSEMREAYYQNLQQQENSIRHIRHDMKNHLSTVRSLLAGKNTDEALSYLDTLLDDVHPTQKDMNDSSSSGHVLQVEGQRQVDKDCVIPAGSTFSKSAFTWSVVRFCENEAANALLRSKVEVILQTGLDYDFRIHLEEPISISDIDLCSLIGNALDNAIRAAASADNKTITLRCRCDKGIFMLKVMNCFDGKLDPKLKTTKPDSVRHGFGISGMREIAGRYGGSLETQIEGNTFTLLVYLYL